MYMHSERGRLNHTLNKYTFGWTCAEQSFSNGALIFPHTGYYSRTQTNHLELRAPDLINPVCARVSSGMHVENTSLVFVQ